MMKISEKLEQLKHRKIEISQEIYTKYNQSKDDIDKENLLNIWYGLHTHIEELELMIESLLMMRK